MKNNLRYKLLFFLIFSFTACQSLPADFDVNKLGTIQRDIPYCTMNRVELKLDIYYPTTKEENWNPIIYVHPGGWTMGTKAVSKDLVDIQALQEQGFLLASVEYRLAPEHKFPAMIEDVKCAVRFLRAHATEFNIDTERFGAIGLSAGGHLVSLLGVTDPTAGFDVGEYTEYSSRVQAIVDLYGITDLAPPFTNRLFFDKLDIFGTLNHEDPIFIYASPVTYVTPDDPPFLIIQGAFDTTVPPNQSTRFFRKLQQSDIEVELIMVENAGHGLLPVDEIPIQPSLEEIREKILLFFIKNLK